MGEHLREARDSDNDLEGKIIGTPTGRARVLVCSRLLDIMLVEMIDDQDISTGKRAHGRPSRLRLVN